MQMNSNNFTICTYLDIINNILDKETLRANCINQVNNYKDNQSNNENKTALIRFTRHISMETFFQSISNSNNELNNANNITNSKGNDNTTKDNINENMNNILNELSKITSNNISENVDTVLLLQLSSILDNLLKSLSIADLKIYLYRYFFAYSLEDISNIYNTSINNVQKSLSNFNNKLMNLIDKNNLNCSNKMLLLSFTDIDDSYLLTLITDNKDTINNNNCSNPNKKKLFSSWQQCLNIVFIIVIVSSLAINISQLRNNKSLNDSTTTEPTTQDTVNDDTDNSTSDNTDEADFNPEAIYITIDNKKTINIEELLKHQLRREGFEGHSSYFTDHFCANYIPIQISKNVPLMDYIGEEIPELAEDFKTFYKLLGNDGMQYIIRNFDDTYTLYHIEKISLYNAADIDNPDSTLRYRQILSDFYGLNSSSNLEEISITFAGSDTGYADYNTRKVIDSVSDLYEIFNLLRSSECNGKTLDNFILENSLSKEYINNNSVQLHIKTKNKATIRRLYYYPDHNFFYDYETDLIYEPVTNKNDKYLVEMLSYNIHRDEPIDPELWNFYIDSYIDSYYINVHLQGDTKQKIKGLYVGSEYRIEKLVNNSWIEAPLNPNIETPPFTPFDHKISSNNQSEMLYIAFRAKYNMLEPGTYRLALTIYDSNSDDIKNPASREFYSEFIVP